MLMQPVTISKNAVACCFASSHEDLHEVTAIFSCADLKTQSVVPSTASQRMDLCLEFRSRFIHINKFLQHILINGLQTVPSTNFGNMDRSITTFGSIFGIHHEVLNEFSIHHAVLNQFFIHHDLLINFPKFLLESVETCQILNEFI